MRHTLLLTALTLLLTACGGVDVSLSTDATEYRPGDTVQLLLQNEGHREVGFNLCFARLEHREDGAWVHTPHRGENEVCQANQLPLPAGSHAEGSLRLPTELPAGEYCVVHDVDTQETDAQGRTVQLPVVSSPFLVGEEGAPRD
jgi:hypothetical protein